MKVYLAGPMSGIEAFNRPAFEKVAEFLRGEGFQVVSPAEVDGLDDQASQNASPDGDHSALLEPYHSYLERDLDIIRTGNFDLIVTLDGWEKSPGANREVGFAAALGVPQVDFALYDPFVGFDLPKEFVPYELNPERQRQVTGGVKDNASKSRVDLIPSKPLIGVGHVLAFGAKKYKPNNWRLGLRWSDTLASAMRHLLAFADGEDIDPETKLPHIDQALCQVLFQSEYFHTNTGIDDRWSSVSEADREAAKA